MKQEKTMIPADQIEAEDLMAFEKEVADIFAMGAIRAPVHLRGGREDHLIRIFREQRIDTDDYIYAYWDAHELALLKGVDRDEVLTAIKDGRSISLCFPEQKMLCSGIVGSLMGTAVGTAWALKQKQKSGRVFLFCGDMSSETGSFHEAVKYAHNYDLPVFFVVCDNGLSVMTDTRDVWNDAEPWFKDSRYQSKIIYFQYQNTYPHSGLGWKVKF